MRVNLRGAIAVTVAAAAAGAAPEQLRVALHPDVGQLVATWVAVGQPAATGGALRYGGSPSTLDSVVNATGAAYANEVCANTTRAVFVAPFPVTPGAPVFYAVTADGTTWSAVQRALPFDARKADLQLSVFGDMGVNCALSSVPALANDTAAGHHDAVLHVGDTGATAG